MAPLKSFSELAFKKDKNLPNLKVPVKGKKGVSKYMRKAGITSKKPYDSEFRQRMVASVQSADRKPEKYVKPDGKVGIRMVKTDKEVIKKESSFGDNSLAARLIRMKQQKKNQKKTDDKEVIKKEAVQYPHMMYDPKTGNEVKAKTPADHNKYAKMGYTHEKPKVDEALTLQQRMKRSRLMKRLKTRIKIGRERAKRKMANKQKLEKRAMRQARAQIAKKLTRGIPKGELSFARKQEIEKRLEKPALKQRIKRIAKRIFKDVRKKEVQRKKG